MTRPGLYLAAPLFNLAEREFNCRIRDCLAEVVDVYLPQADGGLFVELVEQGMDVEKASKRIFDGDIRAINCSEYVLIVMDGRSVDEGAAFELGYAAARGKICIGLQTDMRRLLPIGNNPMITGSLVRVFEDTETLYSWLVKDVGLRALEQRTIIAAAE
jgi:nucleoside 2-deoxyribosyltransferase